MTRYALRCTGCLEVMFAEQEDSRPAPAPKPGEKQLSVKIDGKEYAVTGAILCNVPVEPDCPLCGAPTFTMGPVVRDQISLDWKHPPCDRKCTEAKGPKCSCECGAKNHGIGRMIEAIEGKEAAIARRAEFMNAIGAAQLAVDAAYARFARTGSSSDKLRELDAMKHELNRARSMLAHGSRIRLARAVEAKANAWRAQG